MEANQEGDLTPMFGSFKKWAEIHGVRLKMTYRFAICYKGKNQRKSIESREPQEMREFMTAFPGLSGFWCRGGGGKRGI